MTEPARFDLSRYRLSVDRMRLGVWFDFAAWLESRAIVALTDPKPGTPCVRLAAWQNQAHNEQMARAFEEQGHDKRRAAMRAATARTIVMDWSGMWSGGAETPHSIDAVIALLGDPELPQFEDFVIAASKHEASYRKDLLGN